MFKAINKLTTVQQLRCFSTTSSRLQIDNVLILGSGLMGSGIATSVGLSSHPFNSIVLQDVNQQALDKARDGILSTLVRMKKKAPELDEQKILSKIQFTTKVEAASQDNLLVIEAVPELLSLKQKIFKDLNDQFGKSSSVILATNTSSLPVHEIGENVTKKETFAGLHFFSPVPMMKLVEVVKAEKTNSATMESLVQFVKNINKVPVQCKDTPGFIVNRLLIPYMGEALKLVERGDASIKDVDQAMKLGAGYPLGPFELIDLVGVDVYKFIVSAWAAKGSDFVEESPTIERLYKEGNLGRKTGKGFYEYSKK